MSEIIENTVIGIPPENERPPGGSLIPAENSGEPSIPPNESGADANLPAAKPKFINLKSDVQVVHIDKNSTVDTDTDTQMNDLLDLLGSMRGRRVLTDKIEGVETSESGEPRAVLRHGAFKVIIPSYEAVDPPQDMRGMNPNDVLRYLITKRLGAEIDYIVKGIDQETGLAVASRKEAMAVRSKQFYFGQDREGNNLLYEGAIAEARVLSIIRTGIFVELFGVEAYIPVQELRYQHTLDVSRYFAPGQRILVKILELDKKDPQNIHVTLSVKQAKKNPYDTILGKYIPGNYYIGTVTMVDVHGVFVALDGGVDCLCQFPMRGVPVINSRATVRIYKVDKENKRISGDIVHAVYAIE